MPEPIDYFIDTVKVMAERATEKWAIQIGYNGSYFQNDTGHLLLDNPFRTTDCVAPDGCTDRDARSCDRTGGSLSRQPCRLLDLRGVVSCQ